MNDEEYSEMERLAKDFMVNVNLFSSVGLVYWIKCQFLAAAGFFLHTVLPIHLSQYFQLVERVAAVKI